MFDFFKNEIDFFIRNKTKFSRKNFVETSEKVLQIIELENLYVYEILNNYFEKYNQEKIQILDIGSKNWSYVKGMHNFFSGFCDEFFMDGVEVDAYRLYPNLYSRYEASKFYTKDFSNVNYFCANLLDIKKKYNYITWFLPFLTKYPLKKWGLPKRFFCPEKLLVHAYSLLKKNGQMFIVNQGKYEADIQKKLLDNLEIKYNFLGEIQNEYYPYSQKRYGFLIKKTG